MTDAEYECLNRIRYAMKMHLRWEYWCAANDGCFNQVLDAMDYLVDELWEQACLKGDDR